jgi:hypothetical protein
VTVRRPASTSTTQRLGDSRRGAPRGPLPRTIILRLLPAGLLGAGAAVLVSCGSSGAGLIPSENAGPLVADFQKVEQAALKGGGNCAPTEAALRTTAHDFAALPASVDAGLRAKLQQGIAHLHQQALELCTQPLSTTTGESTSTTPTTAPPSSTKTTTTTAPTGTTPPPSTTPTGTAPTGTTPSSGAEGGTAPEAGGKEEGGAGEGGTGNGQGGLGSGEASEGANNGGAAGPSGGTGSGGSGQ